MKIDTTKLKPVFSKSAEAVFKFSSSDYFLVHSKSSRFGGENMEWSLNYRIDRSEKGKDDDMGIEVIYLSDQEAEALKK